MDDWRGKRVNIYFGNENIFNKLNKESNKSELINNLLTDYYNKDLEFLEYEKQKTIEQKTLIQMKIDNLLETREKINKLKLEEEKIKLDKQKHNLLIDEISALKRSGKISDDEYWKLFKDGKLIKSKAEKLIKIE